MLDSFETWKLKRLSTGAERKGAYYKKELLLSSLIRTQLDFIDYCNNFHESSNGAIAIFTGKQFIFRKNDGNGLYGHIPSLARTYLAMRDMYPTNVSYDDVTRIVNAANGQYISMMFEVETSITNDTYYGIRISIKEPLSKEEFVSFKMFYDEFNDVIRKYPFRVSVTCYPANGGYKTLNDVTNLDELYSYLESIVDEKVKPFIDSRGEKLLGSSNERYIHSRSR